MPPDPSGILPLNCAAEWALNSLVQIANASLLLKDKHWRNEWALGVYAIGEFSSLEICCVPSPLIMQQVSRYANRGLPSSILRLNS